MLVFHFAYFACLCAYIVLVFDVYVIYLLFRADDDVDVVYLSQLLIFTIFVFNLSQSEVNKNFFNFTVKDSTHKNRPSQ